jgi:hypothetical protein
MSYTGDDLLYIRLPGPPVRGAPGSAAHRARWAADLSARHRAHGGQLNNHACWLRNLLPSLEAKHKFTLPPGTDIQALAITTHQHIRAGTIDGWICEHGNDGGFIQGDFTNHLFAITRPARKRYPRPDTATRRPHSCPRADSRPGRPRPGHPRPVRPHSRMGRHLPPRPLQRHARKPRNRPRLLDHVRPVHHRTRPSLIQAEVEYIRSRTLRTSSRSEILGQLTELAARTRDLLSGRGIAHTEDQMSKLTWPAQIAEYSRLTLGLPRHGTCGQVPQFCAAA